MGAKSEGTDPRRIAARLAGFLYLAVILLAFGGSVVLSNIEGSGTFHEIAQRVAASERLCRLALGAVVAATIGGALLAFALYATLRSTGDLLAQLALILSVGDSVLGLVVRMSEFVRLHLFVSARSADPAAAAQLADLMRSIGNATEGLGGILFGAGSALFFLLFFRSRTIPRLLSGLGLLASLIWTASYFADLVFPERRALLQDVYLPAMFVADILTGFYLLLFAVRLPTGPVSAKL